MSTVTPTRQQSAAANPAANIVVSANAGTGKTRVLIQRILNMLQADPTLQPHEILAITFTRAGAAEIAKRVNEAARKADPELAKRLTDAARQIQVMTINGFCQDILQTAPQAAGLLPNFKLLDKREQHSLTQTALGQTLNDEDLLNALNYFGKHASEATVTEALKKALSSDDVVGITPVNIAKKLGVAPDFSYAEFDEKWQNWGGTEAEQKRLGAVLSALESGGKTAQTAAASMREAVAQQKTDFVSLTQGIFVKDRSKVNSKIDGKTMDLLGTWPEEMMALEQQRATEHCYLFTASYLQLAHAVRENYARLKRAENAIDFNDQINYAARLLTDSDARDWVQFQLDRKLKHILIDEAQDTDPKQWRIFDALSEEILSGEGQHEGVPRSLFIVGDEKQSIYRFRGAASHVFARIVNGEDQRVEQVSLTKNFRSGPAILQATDTVCAGLFGEHYQAHQAHHEDRYSVVEIWPLLKKDKNKKDDEAKAEPWQWPELTDPHVGLAQDLAKQVMAKCRQLLNSNIRLASKDDRPINASDIMILFRSRGAIMQAIAAELTRAGLRHTGVDRLELSDDIAVQDIAALLHVLTCPSDDFHVAQVLKSPFIGLNDDDLIAISQQAQQADTSWLEALATQQPSVYAQFIAWLNDAQQKTPHALLRKVINQTDFVAKTLYQRSGGQHDAPVSLVTDAVDFVLTMALDYTDALTFLHDLETLPTELKREPSVADGAIRLLTVHGAKGLEAPIVILPDTTQLCDASMSRDRLIFNEDKSLCLYKTKPEIDAMADFKKAEQKQLKQDDAQLLYVAMTRAEEYLFVAGIETKDFTASAKDQAKYKEKQQKCWYGLIDIATKDWQTVGDNDVRQLVCGTPPETAEKDGAGVDEITLPAWATTVVDSAAKPAATAQSEEAKLGDAVHKLLELLPNVTETEKAVAAKRWLQSQPLTTEQQAEALRQATLCLSRHPQMFTNGKAEVPLIDSQQQARRIDLLLEQDDEVWVVDFKSDASPSADIPPAYAQQLQRYTASVAKIYPHKRVKSAILWTVTAELAWLE